MEVVEEQEGNTIRPILPLWHVRSARLPSKEYAYLKRKLQLIIRDPYIKKFIEELDNLSYHTNVDWPEEMHNLQRTIANKWNVSIYSKKDPYAPLDEMNKIIDPEDKYPFFIRQIGLLFQTLEPVEAHFLFNHTSKTVKKEFMEYVPPGDRKMYFTVNLNLINQNDAKHIKKVIWEYIKRYLPKEKHMKKNPCIYGEPEVLLPIYRCSDKTFNKYLEWYDIHTQEKIGFRLIAFIEQQRKLNPIKAKENLEKIKVMPKPPKICKPIKGEDAIEKGVKLIYEAIHRKPYIKKDIEPLLEEYNCPQHPTGDCPPQCRYLKNWYSKIRRLLPVN